MVDEDRVTFKVDPFNSNIFVEFEGLLDKSGKIITGKYKANEAHVKYGLDGTFTLTHQ